MRRMGRDGLPLQRAGTKVLGVREDGVADRVLQWTETDGLGHLRYVRTGTAAGRRWRRCG